MKKEQESSLPGLVLSGGGARGAFQVGVWRHLQHDPVFKDKPVVLSGTSAGALNSAFIAAGLEPDEMMDFWLGLTENPPVQVSQRFMLTLLFSLMGVAAKEPLTWLQNGVKEGRRILTRIRNHAPFKPGSGPAIILEHILASRWDIVSDVMKGIEEPFVADIFRLRDRLVRMFGGENVPTGENRLAINAVDVETGNVTRFINYDPGVKLNAHYKIVKNITVDMVMASAAIPLLFNPVRVDGRLMWDGGLLSNTPLAPAVAMEADEIVAVMVTKGPQQGFKMTNFGQAVERVADAFLENSYNLDRTLLLDRNRLAERHGLGYRKVKLYREIRPDSHSAFTAGSYLYFNKDILREMHDHGVTAVLKWIRAGIEEDRLAG